MGLIGAAALCQTASGQTFSPTSHSHSYSCVWVGSAPTERLKDLTFYFQPVEDVSGHGVHLQLTGALPLHLIQDQRAAGGEETGTTLTKSQRSFFFILLDDTLVGSNRSCAEPDSPGQGALLPSDKRAPQGAVVELGYAGALPGADAGTAAECCLTVWDSRCVFWGNKTKKKKKKNF